LGWIVLGRDVDVVAVFPKLLDLVLGYDREALE